MALDRLLPVSTTPGAVSGNSYMDAVQEEVTGLWDRARIRLTGVSGTNTITATFVPALTAGLVDGMNAVLRPVATNTGAVTLNGVAVRDGEGNALAAGALRINGVYDLHYVSAITAWCIVGYFPAAVAVTGLTYLGTVNVSAGALADTTFFGSGGYRSHKLILKNILPVTNTTEILLQVHAGGIFQVSGYASQGTFSRNNAAVASTGTTTATTTALALTSNNVSNSGIGVSGEITVSNLAGTSAPKMFVSHCVWQDSGNTDAIGTYSMGGVWLGGNGAIDGFQLIALSGALTSGSVDVYGML